MMLNDVEPAAWATPAPKPNMVAARADTTAMENMRRRTLRLRFITPPLLQSIVCWFSAIFTGNRPNPQAQYRGDLRIFGPARSTPGRRGSGPCGTGAA